MKHMKALAAALLVPLVVAACLFAPGKFESTLTIHADRSFTYSYKGEVVAIDLTGMMNKAIGGMAAAFANNASESGDDSALDNMMAAEDTPEEKAKKEAEYREIAVKLKNEAGYRDVQYRGEGVFWVDYEISGVLTHNFVFPYNQDTGMALPFLGIELRGKDMVRFKAPGFSSDSENDEGGMGSSEEALKRLDGTFTLITDAEVVSSNGTAASVGGQRTMWKVNTSTSEAPAAELRVKPLP